MPSDQENTYGTIAERMIFSIFLIIILKNVYKHGRICLKGKPGFLIFVLNVIRKVVSQFHVLMDK